MLSLPAAPSQERETVHRPLDEAATWYKDGVFYELHVRAFCDANGDGIGDFKGLLGRLDYLAELGVTGLWLLPFYPSPLRDDGYDISDYRGVHPAYGTLMDFRRVLREAHRRGMKVITELVLAHSSDQHPWFQRARRARPGSIQRDFYVWSDTPDRFGDARVIFTDYETSNWSFDPVAHAYYWHRFYSHQPSLNYDNPDVRQAMFDVVDHWLAMGVDGLRLDAVPYLYAREGTTCENLPETFDFLRSLRRHVDARFEGRMLLAEANQWPEDAVAYMGDGPMCHMAFHFPLMPRMFMAARQEDRYPIVDILAETPTLPPECQWGLFLRNHDELTLEMVTDEERDYMYRVYAQDPQARVNVGIRRRLAPLLGGDRKLIEMMNGLLLSMPGTPIIYYGDEIGMGDNIYLGDRNAVRTPMQWDSDRNAGFSHANPQRLYLPVIIDPEYHSQALNVAAQQESPNSLLWWMKRLIGVRQRYKVFGRGSIEMVRAENRKVLSFLRHYRDETVLVVVNLSRFAQCVQLDLSRFRGAVPVELLGNVEFPPIGDLPYFITLGPHGFYWFSLEDDTRGTESLPTFSVSGSWETLFRGRPRRAFQAFLPRYLSGQRWFVHKTRTITSASFVDAVPVRSDRPKEPPLAEILIVRVELDFGEVEHYLLPLAFATGDEAEELRRFRPESVLATLEADGEKGILFDALVRPEFTHRILDALTNRRSLPGAVGRVTSVPAASRRVLSAIGEDATIGVLAAEHSNSSVSVSDRALVKFVRRVETGVNPAVELGRFLTESARYERAPQILGSLEYRRDAPVAEPATIAIMEEFVSNEGDGWNYLVDSLVHGLEDVLAASHADGFELSELPPRIASLDGSHIPPGHPLVGPHIEWAALLGRRTAELHIALASDRSDPRLAPEPLTMMERRAMFHGARNLVRRVFRQAAQGASEHRLLSEVLEREGEIVGRLRSILSSRLVVERIRCHGDLHLGQVLWTGRDFVFIDFEGEPARSLAQRRRKRPAIMDVAGMIRSLHYASRAAAMSVTRDLAGSVALVEPARLESWLTFWYRWVAGTFLSSYSEAVDGQSFVPCDEGQLATLLDFFLLEKGIYELSYEANARPEWIAVPASGILETLAAAP
ncbi:MAG: maltose alpha-D-glucosyltransferase [Acidimicrobiales bacterium]